MPQVLRGRIARHFDPASLIWSVSALKSFSESLTVGAQGLVTLSGGSEQFIAGDEYEQVYLTSVYLCARVIEMAREYSVQPVQLLICAGFAGNTTTANLIIRTGRALGVHFDLLDDVQPTVLFKVFFGQALIELDQHLMSAV
jgi:hypothetical protein